MNNSLTLYYFTDEKKLHKELRDALGQDSIEVVMCPLSIGVSEELFRQEPSLVLVDCPGGVEGLVVCQDVRKIYSGLMLLLSRDVDVQLSILAMKFFSADSSFALSLGTNFLAAYIKALLRRFARNVREQLLVFDDLVIDATRREVIVSEKKVELSSVEFQLIWFLAQNSGLVVTRNEIHSALYDSPYNGYDRSIDLYISRVRQKIGDNPIEPVYLKTVRGVGYQFLSPEKMLSTTIS